jgi:FkbM family methyltransferase
MRLKELFARAIGTGNYVRYIMSLSELYRVHTGFKSLGTGIITSRLVPKGGVVLDIGANIGRFTAFIAPAVGKTGAVYSFEPVAMSSRILSFYVKLHRLKQVTVVKAAVSDRSGIASITVPMRSGWKPQLSIAHLGGSPGPNEATEEIRLLDLDSFCTSTNIRRIDFIKCDTEGHEFSVFSGGMSTLKRDTPSIFCEIEKPYCDRLNLAPDAVFSLLRSIGYRAYLPLSDQTMKPVDGYTKRGDYFFIHPAKMNDSIEQCVSE